MRPIELALKYMASFYGETPLASMIPLLADDLIFKGPFFEFDSAKDYLASLQADPPQEAKYQILDIYEKKNSVCLIYHFSKPGVETTMVQIFEIKKGKIARIKLIFDTAAFG